MIIHSADERVSGSAGGGAINRSPASAGEDGVLMVTWLPTAKGEGSKLLSFSFLSSAAARKRSRKCEMLNVQLLFPLTANTLALLSFCGHNPI